MSSEYLYTLHCLILTSYSSVLVQLNINDLLLSLKLRRCRRCRSFSLNQLRSTSDCNCSTWYTRYIFNPMVNIHPINHLCRNIHIEILFVLSFGEQNGGVGKIGNTIIIFVSLYKHKHISMRFKFPVSLCHLFVFTTTTLWCNLIFQQVFKFLKLNIWNF